MWVTILTGCLINEWSKENRAKQWQLPAQQIVYVHGTNRHRPITICWTKHDKKDGNIIFFFSFSLYSHTQFKQTTYNNDWGHFVMSFLTKFLPVNTFSLFQNTIILYFFVRTAHCTCTVMLSFVFGVEPNCSTYVIICNHYLFKKTVKNVCMYVL